ncbi:MAG: hypothetical protein Q9P01_05700 [Anaerolineae bacterium]|nr:hypothetical protein [Anaerolineae bacterium]
MATLRIKTTRRSLFGLLGELQNQVSLGFTAVNTQIEAAMGGISDNQREIATIKQEREAEKEQWQKRRADAIALAKWFFTTRIGILITLLLLGSVAMVIFLNCAQYLLKTCLKESTTYQKEYPKMKQALKSIFTVTLCCV